MRNDDECAGDRQRGDCLSVPSVDQQRHTHRHTQCAARTHARTHANTSTHSGTHRHTHRHARARTHTHTHNAHTHLLDSHLKVCAELGILIFQELAAPLHIPTLVTLLVRVRLRALETFGEDDGGRKGGRGEGRDFARWREDRRERAAEMESLEKEGAFRSGSSTSLTP